MHIIHDTQSLRTHIRSVKSQGQTIGFVPTMGYLHDGHLSLVHIAAATCDVVVVSIFVNPTQFGPNEDLTTYPRDEEGDLRKLREAGVSAVFLPRVHDMYPVGSTTTVRVLGPALPLEGERRPDHFEGVATIVNKLFNLVLPDVAVFGRKDYQQCMVVEKMVHDLNMPVQLHFAPTKRESDGLAMSSRNSYLSSDERARAKHLSNALQAARLLYKRGERSQIALVAAMQEALELAQPCEVDYAEVRDAQTLEGRDLFGNEPLVFLLAVKIGKTRLIDNMRTDDEA